MRRSEISFRRSGLPWLVAGVIAFVTVACSAAAPADGRRDAALDTLLRMRVIGRADAWRERAVKGNSCPGAEVATLLLGIAGTFEPVVTLDDALVVLAREKIVWNDYWRAHAVTGGQCDGEYVANLLRAAAEPLADRALVLEHGPPAGLLPAAEPTAFAAVPTASGLGAPNTVIGTQTIGGRYRFTSEPLLVETAEAIRAMGSDTIKFHLWPGYGGAQGNVEEPRPGIQSLVELARDEPAHRRVLDMPFSRILLWAHTFHKQGSPDMWRKGLSDAAAEAERHEIYDLACHLLRTYSGSGKTFYIGHWEGDGWLRGTVDAANDARVDEVACQGMADWLTVRQRAVDDAKRDTPHEGVALWHYTEVNHVKLAMQGRPALVNRVLPRVPVDLVSYSCYDTQQDPALLKAALSFIETQLPPKPGIAGRRVFIGEYGFPADRFPPPEQDRLSRQVIKAGLEWGAPLILYWELYNNELTADGRQRGFWMIDDKGQKQPIYRTHEAFYARARNAVAESERRHDRPQSAMEFRAAALEFLARP
ncbi:MAG: hypothetical protein RLZZ111_828 [Planctomycetota bacterium]